MRLTLRFAPLTCGQNWEELASTFVFSHPASLSAMAEVHFESCQIPESQRTQPLEERVVEHCLRTRELDAARHRDRLDYQRRAMWWSHFEDRMEPIGGCINLGGLWALMSIVFPAIFRLSWPVALKVAAAVGALVLYFCVICAVLLWICAVVARSLGLPKPDYGRIYDLYMNRDEHYRYLKPPIRVQNTWKSKRSLRP